MVIRKKSKSLLLIILGMGMVENVILSPGAVGQIIPDGTLPQRTIVTVEGNRMIIEGGSRAGGNLFHSFAEFGVPTGGEAFFNNAVDVTNILSRVTGDKISNIDGLIRANGGANLFLINPRGIVFGPNARLNVGGDFIGSTAESIEFPSGSTFSATNPEKPLLTINIPIGLNFRENDGKIAVLGVGNSLIFDPQTFRVLRERKPVGLEVHSGQTLALVGGKVEMSGGSAIAPRGRIELSSVRDGMVGLSATTNGLELDYGGVDNFGDLHLSQAALVDASGSGGGNIQVRGRQVTVREGSAIVSNTQGSDSGGSLSLTASESVEVVGTKADGRFFSSLLTLVQPIATGDGGNLTISSGSLRVADGAQIATDTYGSGKAGELRVQATDVELEGTTPDGFLGSGLRTDVQLGGTGDGGNLTVTTENLRLINGGQLSSANFGPGTGGQLTVEAAKIEALGNGALRGLQNSTLLTAVSGIYTSALPGSTGKGGMLNITTGWLLVTNGASIQARTFGSGDAGNILVRATEVVVTGDNSPVASSLSASVEPDSTGNGGRLTLLTSRLLIANGARIQAATSGSGNAGDITVLADDIEIIGTSAAGGDRSGGGLFASAEGTGNAGTLMISTERLTLADGAEVSVSSRAAGSAGNLIVVADDLRLDRGSNLSAETVERNQANIMLTVKDIHLRRGSDISTNATGEGTGGNITINAEILTALQDSDITANAVEGNGGQIAIATRGLFLSADSEITASSQSGIDGTVEISRLDKDPGQGLIAFTENVVDPADLINQNFCQQARNSAFYRIGRGGLPANPGQYLSGSNIRVNLVSPVPEREAVSLSTNSQQPATLDREPAKIVPARGWVMLADGRVSLVAYQTPGATPRDDLPKNRECHDSD